MEEETTQIGLRLPNRLISRLTQYAEKQEAKIPGLTVSRTDAIKMLLTQALNLDDQEKPPANKPKKAPRANSTKKRGV